MNESIYDFNDCGPVPRFSVIGARSPHFKGSKSDSNQSQTDRKITADGEAFILNISEGSNSNSVTVETADDEVLQAAFDQVASFSKDALGTVENLSKGNLEAAERTQNSVKDLVAENNQGRTENTNIVITGMIAAALTYTAVEIAKTRKGQGNAK